MTTRLGPLRHLRHLVLLSTAALLAGSTLLAPADAQAPAGVTGADLPQVTRVDNVFPYLKDGRRLLIRSRTLEYADESCIFQSEGYPAESVRFASFVTEDSQAPFFEGKEDPTFVVYEFDSAASARTGYGKIAAYVRSCQGPHSQDGTRFNVQKVHVPRLGQKTIAYRTIKTDEQGDKRQDLEIYVLQGKRIERSWIQLDRGSATVSHVVRMARILRDTARP